MLLILIVIVFPIAYTGWISLTNMNLYHWTDYEVIGLSNYARALFKFDYGFLSALGTTLVWTALNMVIQIGLGFLIALGLNAPGLNKFLVLLGFGKVDFLASNGIAFLSCMVLNLWMALPFMISTIDGALQSVDSSLYESATLDGAGFWTRTRSITVPTIRPIIAPAAVMTTFITFKQFDIIYLLTQQRGYMTGATLNTVITYAHQNAFASNNYGLSSAVSMLLFVIIILFSILTNRSLRED